MTRPLSPEVLCTEVPLSNPQRLARWKAKVSLWALERWVELTSHERPEVLGVLGDPEELPPFLRRQAE